MCFHDIVADLESMLGVTLPEDDRREMVSMLIRCYNDVVRANAITSVDAAD